MTGVWIHVERARDVQLISRVAALRGHESATSRVVASARTSDFFCSSFFFFLYFFKL